MNCGFYRASVISILIEEISKSILRQAFWKRTEKLVLPFMVPFDAPQNNHFLCFFTSNDYLKPMGMQPSIEIKLYPGQLPHLSEKFLRGNAIIMVIGPTSELERKEKKIKLWSMISFYHS
ncbi:hypothetical protein AVEN_210196-1 [Araneus ventricosus]|uniref:Uncharacterized protein n=1 Tax=Araneus ventricosus TaxID=182803 RepID=A0A4Y1ZW27_ARAVE|nr:hypothetical protein AVEN_66922-1 [Araneus ventricosus]GBL70796.1 hypothetical protein AVEN_210196-1 [Araneus ventricosus]